MTRRKKHVYLTIIGLGAIALVVDRLLLPQDTATPATAAADVSPQQAHEDTGVASVPRLPIPELPFPNGLDAFALSQSPGGPRDLFARPVSQSDLTTENPGTDKNGRRGRGKNSPRKLGHAEFERAHTLGGVLIHQRLKIAVVNGAWMRTGDSIDGCRLARVDGNQVAFECYDGTALLKIVSTDVLRTH